MSDPRSSATCCSRTPDGPPSAQVNQVRVASRSTLQPHAHPVKCAETLHGVVPSRWGQLSPGPEFRSCFPRHTCSDLFDRPALEKQGRASAGPRLRLSSSALLTRPWKRLRLEDIHTMLAANGSWKGRLLTALAYTPSPRSSRSTGPRPALSARRCLACPRRNAISRSALAPVSFRASARAATHVRDFSRRTESGYLGWQQRYYELPRTRSSTRRRVASVLKNALTCSAPSEDLLKGSSCQASTGSTPSRQGRRAPR